MRKFFYIFVGFAAACLWTPEIYAQQAGAFARMGLGARGLAMGNGLAADASGAASPYYNPALAPYVSRPHFRIAYALLSHDRFSQHLQFATSLDERAGVAVGLIHAGISDIDGRDESGYHTQTYSTNEYALLVSFGIQMSDRISGGVGLRIYRARYVPSVEPATGLGLTAGLSARMSERLQLGVVVNDLLASYSWDTSSLYGTQGRQTTDQFPVRIRVGAAFHLAEETARFIVEYESRVLYAERRGRGVEVVGHRPVQTSAVTDLRYHQGGLRLGGEWNLVESFTIRAGVSGRQQSEAHRIVPSTGFAIVQEIGEIAGHVDYAAVLEPYGTGLRHVLGLRIDL